MLEPITTSDVLSDPPFTSAVVVISVPISIPVNPDTSLPTANSPTVTILSAPSSGAYIFVASVESNLLFICVCILDIAPSNKLILSAPTVTDTLSNLRVFALTSPLVP